jgi:hypothetical protein
MSYHDSNYHSRLEDIGMEVINPLHKQQKRLSELETFLKELKLETSDEDLKERIDKILK